MDRTRNKIIDIRVSETREKSVFLEMAWDLEDRGYEVKYYVPMVIKHIVIIN